MLKILTIIEPIKVDVFDLQDCGLHNLDSTVNGAFKDWGFTQDQIISIDSHIIRRDNEYRTAFPQGDQEEDEVSNIFVLYVITYEDYKDE